MNLLIRLQLFEKYFFNTTLFGIFVNNYNKFQQKTVNFIFN